MVERRIFACARFRPENCRRSTFTPCDVRGQHFKPKRIPTHSSRCLGHRTPCPERAFSHGRNTNFACARFRRENCRRSTFTPVDVRGQHFKPKHIPTHSSHSLGHRTPCPERAFSHGRNTNFARARFRRENCRRSTFTPIDVRGQHFKPKHIPTHSSHSLGHRAPCAERGCVGRR